MSKTLDLIRNADDSTMVDFRRNNQIDSVPIDDLRALLPTEMEMITRRLAVSQVKMNKAFQRVLGDAVKDEDYLVLEVTNEGQTLGG